MQEVKRKRGGNVKNAPPGFYTSREARERLGIKPSAFQTMITKGEIERIIPPLRSEGFYRVEDINKLANQSALFFLQNISAKQVSVEFGRATEDDIQGIFDVVASLWGAENTTPIETHRILYHANPYIDYVVKFRGLVLGYINATPYIPETLQAIMEGRKRGIDLSSRDVLPYKSGNSYDVYVGIVVRQDVPGHTYYATKLIEGFFKTLCDFAREGITISHMYAISDQEHSIKISQRLGFEEDSSNPGRFVLDVETANSKLIKQYRDVIHQIKSGQVLETKKPTTEFREATVDDIDQEAELAGLVFGEKASALEERKAFVRANPHADHHLYDQGKLVAYIDLIPMKHEAIMEWVEGRAIVWNIDPKNIESFEPGKPVECLIADMITSPTIPLVKRTYYGRALLRGLLDKLVEMGKQGIDVTKIYAGSDPKTPQGLRIIEEAGFQEIHRRGEGKVISVLDVMKSDKKFLQAYQEAINQWKEEQNAKEVID